MEYEHRTVNKFTVSELKKIIKRNRSDDVEKYSLLNVSLDHLSLNDFLMKEHVIVNRNFLPMVLEEEADWFHNVKLYLKQKKKDYKINQKTSDNPKPTFSKVIYSPVHDQSPNLMLVDEPSNLEIEQLNKNITEESNMKHIKVLFYDGLPTPVVYKIKKVGKSSKFVPLDSEMKPNDSLLMREVISEILALHHTYIKPSVTDESAFDNKKLSHLTHDTKTGVWVCHIS